MSSAVVYKRNYFYLAIVLTFAALGWRMIGIGEWPYRFHETVQYESALEARKIWLTLSPSQRTPERSGWFDAVGDKHITSPPIFPAMVALVYSATGTEIPWVASVFGCVFWLAAGWFIFFASVRMTHSSFGGLVGLTWFTFKSFGVSVSKSFQTEPLLALGFAIAIWHLAKPREWWSWRDVLATGLLCGLVSLLKPGVLILPLVAAFTFLVVGGGIREQFFAKALKSIAFAAIVLAPAFGYAAFMLKGHVRAKIIPELLLEQSFYIGVGQNIHTSVGAISLAVASAGILIAWRAGKFLPCGLIAGYAGYICVFTQHTSTHSYYHVPLMVIAAISMGWVASWLAKRPTPFLGSMWAKSIAVVVVFAGFLFSERYYYIGAWQLRPSSKRILAEAVDQQSQQVDRYRRAQAVLPRGARIVAFSEFYGYPIEYYSGFLVSDWPASEDVQFRSRFDPIWSKARTPKEALSGYIRSRHSYFVITDVPRFLSDPDLAAALDSVGTVRFSQSDLIIYSLDVAE